ncbi:hypothetical protein E8E13_004259 [Curvularia kusanoi]|uniref:Uncharacterized protein n=1 Tax=Curvularia kusanoi TaxID=90978 RepID=A0A9P4WD71_CURKU|nr:hypothetical protein E8E13_004259 [Curvularia kusanoi]
MSMRNRLIVGLDYGTTFTGVAYCESSGTGRNGEQVEIIHDWPSQYTQIGMKEKVPSEITYQSEGLLDTQQRGEAAKIFRELSRSRQTERKEPVEIVADYLAQVKTHLIKNLDKKYGKTL